MKLFRLTMTYLHGS